MLNGVCQIAVEKKKKETVGEHLLPVCKIVFSKLKRFEGRVSSFVDDQNIVGRLFPLDSDKEALQAINNDIEKIKSFEGSQVLALLRHQLLQITDLDEKWQVSVNVILSNCCDCYFCIHGKYIITSAYI